MGIHEVPDVKIGETVGVVEGVGMTIDVLELGVTGGEGSFTQWVHCEFVVSLEAIRPVITQQVCGEFF